MINQKELANALRFLSVDAVEKAKSGHPGMPLGMADIATVLWRKFLKHNPQNPQWFNRDRFVLSNGHGSMLLYALLHLSGYDLSLEDLMQFRQLHSKTPGHPEYGDTPGVETTTGPLGQGLANAVGMAIAEQVLAATYNCPDYELVNHKTYAFVGDGCLMEGLSHEVCSLAGTLKLGKLVVFYDDNGISIDGQIQPWFSEDVKARFLAYGWEVIGAIDGHDEQEIEAAIKQAQLQANKPTLVICKTTIGFGSRNAGSEKTHGAPLGDEDIHQLRGQLDWPYPPFSIPDHYYEAWSATDAGRDEETGWLGLCNEYKAKFPEKYREFLRRIQGDLPDDWPQQVECFLKEAIDFDASQATRKSSQACIEYFAAKMPELLGGSADLTGSNNTNHSKTIPITPTAFHGNYLHYGVREFGMAAMMNGIALHGGFIPYGGTFLVFSDYARNAIRLSALMHQRVIYVLTHDSIGLGEDGPTHQPIEHAAMLRMTPNLLVWRPADFLETAVAWTESIAAHRNPSCLLLSRQGLPQLPHHREQVEQIKRGGYIVDDSEQDPDVIVIATGSEVSLAHQAVIKARLQGLQVRLVSMPCAERFLAQDRVYQEAVIPSLVRRRIVVEAGATAYWAQFTGLDGEVLGIDQFGVSAPAEAAYQALGLTVETILSAIEKQMNS